MKIGVFEGCEYQSLFEFLQSKNLPEIEWTEVQASDWRTQNCDVYCLSQKESGSIFSKMTRLPSEVRSTGACDLILKEGGQFWPHNLTSLVLPQVLIQKCPHLDTQAFGYVTGEGSWARTLIGTMIQMGFSKINWTSIDVIQSEEVAKSIRTAFFGIKLNVLSSADLNLQPNNGSLLLNTLSTLEHPEILVDLTYLNFVQKGGLVADLTLEPFEKNILLEAQNVGINVLHGAELAWAWWLMFCDKWKPTASKDLTYQEFESFLKSRPRPS